MLVARCMYPVQSLGPGNRLGIWMCGCNRRCRSCANPELWAFDKRYEITPEALFHAVEKILSGKTVEGITISGGEPFEQPQELLRFLQLFPPEMTDILVFTGYTIQQLLDRCQAETDALLDRIGVLIDGEYREEENNGSILRGSDNQVIHILRPELEPRYQMYLQAPKRLIQNFASDQAMYSVGLHEKGFREKLKHCLEETDSPAERKIVR